MSCGNLFVNRNYRELILLYSQFLNLDAMGNASGDEELGKIQDQYRDAFGADSKNMLEHDLFDAIADSWHARQVQKGK